MRGLKRRGGLCYNGGMYKGHFPCLFLQED